MVGFFREAAKAAGESGRDVRRMIKEIMSHMEITTFELLAAVAGVAALHVLLLTAVVFIASKNNKTTPPADPKNVIPDCLSVTAVALMPQTIAALLSAIILTVFTYGVIGIFASVLLCTVALIFMLFLFDAGVEKYMEDIKKRSFFLAFGFAVVIAVYVVVFNAFLPGMVLEELFELI